MYASNLGRARVAIMGRVWPARRGALGASVVVLTVPQVVLSVLVVKKMSSAKKQPSAAVAAALNALPRPLCAQTHHALIDGVVPC